jgi:hypothetical protein
VQDRLLRQEGEPAHEPRLLVGEARRPQRRLRLQRELEPAQKRLLADLGLLALLLDRGLQPLEPALDDLEVGQHQLQLEVEDVAAGVGGAARLVVERAHDVQQGVRVAELLGLQGSALALLDAGEVDDLERRVRRLLRLEQRGEPVHAGIGNTGDARVQLGAPAVVARRRHAGTGQQVEQRRLATLGEPEQADLHGIDYSGRRSMTRASTPSRSLP